MSPPIRSSRLRLVDRLRTEGARSATYRTGQIVLEPASDLRRVGIICKGSVTIWRISPRGRQLAAASLREGDWFENVFPTDGQERTIVEADGPVTIAWFDVPAFRRLAQRHPVILRDLIQRQVSRLAAVQQRAAQTALDSVAGSASPVEQGGHGFNLARMVDRVAARAAEGPQSLLSEALAVRDEEVAASLSMGRLGAALVDELVSQPDAVTALTICNTGGLAAVERGTALGVIRTVHEQGRLALAIATETRPLLQGARLTAWELERMGAPFRVVVDAAGPALLARGMADIVLTGADRIASNGDTANKIGTFALAVAARYAAVPFVVVAPESSVDMDTSSGEDISIEDRGADEVVKVRGTPIAPEGTGALNPAFDVTPAELITAIVTDRRVVRLDRGESLRSVPPDP